MKDSKWISRPAGGTRGGFSMFPGLIAFLMIAVLGGAGAQEQLEEVSPEIPPAEEVIQETPQPEVTLEIPQPEEVTQEISPAEEKQGEPAYYNELLLVLGAEGESEYGQVFVENRDLWREAAGQGKVKVTTIEADDEDALRAVESYLAASPKDEAMPLWVVFIGHGTYDKRVAYFNLAGPDLSAEALNEWLAPFERPLIILNTASSSGAFLPVLSRENRIVVTATKSGTEVNFASFGSYLANALLEPEADFNNDGENSIFELFQYAARQTADYYEQEGRIQTETPLIDDNGDGQGTSLEALEALREGGTSSREPDGSFAKRWALVLSPAEQAIPPKMRQKRNVLESQIDDLRRRRSELDEELYYSQLEVLAVQIADLYATWEEAEEKVESEAEEEAEPEGEAEEEAEPEEEVQPEEELQREEELQPEAEPLSSSPGVRS